MLKVVGGGLFVCFEYEVVWFDVYFDFEVYVGMVLGCVLLVLLCEVEVDG